jgi:alpha-1,6-mannosyltransferase
VIVEAMASGTPVVASTRGAGPEIVTPDSGQLVEPDDPHRLADAVEQLLDASEQLREGARTRAAQFDIATTAAGVLAVYDELGVA